MCFDQVMLIGKHSDIQSGQGLVKVFIALVDTARFTLRREIVSFSRNAISLNSTIMLKEHCHAV